jgi:hypothetical protein
MRILSTFRNFSKKNRKIFALIIILFLISYLFLNLHNHNLSPDTGDQTHDAAVPPDNDHDLKNNVVLPILNNSNNNKTIVSNNSNNKLLDAIRPKPPVHKINDKKVIIYATDHSGLGDQGVVDCGNNLEVHLTSDAQRANFSYYLGSLPALSHTDKYKENGHRHYHMVFAMESEPHSGGGESWKHADFRMWYALDKSFPEPATYFDIKLYLPDLLAPPRVDFDKKEKNSLLVWILSNCNAHNARQVFVQKLMNEVKVDSFGGCLNNNHARGAGRMTGNDNVFADYKFVITIENSNCEDYITEKLVYAVKSGSIPLVAGKNGKPDYARYLPKNSYINVYDFKSANELAKYLTALASNRTEYERRLYFKFKHNYTHEFLSKQPLARQIEIAKEILGADAEKEFFEGIIAKEKSENKVCKVARYLNENDRAVVEAEIKKRSMNRPSTSEACLENGNLGSIPQS